MFTALASYLLGSSNQETAGGVEENNVRLTSIISDDDWVLVDRDSEGNSEDESSSSVGECETFENPSQFITLHTRSSSTASLPCMTMEESWFLTPPPCFTSAGPIHMETSPLENLLIEHPSMSVYQHTQTPHLARRYNSASVQPLPNDEEDTIVRVHRVEEVQIEIRRQAQTPKRNCVDVLRQQERQQLKTKQAQKVQIQKAYQTLRRGYLQRTNKAREVNCHNRRLRRNERSQGATRSCANNNRKC